MKVYSYCAPCMTNRVMASVLQTGADEKKRRKLFQAFMKMMAKEFNPSACPSFIGTLQSLMVARYSGVADPFKKKKDESIERAKTVYPILKNAVGSIEDEFKRMRTALLLSVAANVIEVSAPQHKVDVNELEKEVLTAMRAGLAIDDSKEIIDRIKKAKTIVFCCDNCGESVLDRVLLKELEGEVFIAVASGPIDDDITAREAKQIELAKFGTVVKKGRCFGIWREKAPSSFNKLLDECDLIIAKGMANYETLTEYPKLKRKTAFLLKVKCRALADDLKLRVGSNVAKAGWKK